MRNEAVIKLFVLLVLVGLSMVPLGLVWSVVAERARYRDRVVSDVAQASAGAQLLFGPMLVIETPARRIGDASGAVHDSIVRGHQQVLLPDSLSIRSVVRVETRQRGIYRVPVYRAANRFLATFAVPARPEIAPGFASVGPARSSIVFGISDPRGLRVIPVVKLDGVLVKASPETGLTWVPQGFSAPFELSGTTSSVSIEADIDLTGTDRIGFVPLGASTEAALESDWPHPGFTGGFGPDEREISKNGFRARWRLSRFATGVPGEIATRTRTKMLDKHGDDLSVRFVQPVDVYQQSERAVKYGLLFVVLTFVAFFLFETLRRLAIHPVQYSLVAAALAIFFLLLISLSEHLPFAAAYVTASGACVTLLVFYTGHVLRSTFRGLGFGALLSTLYALLYVILQSEDYALLLGALLLFATLAVVMVTTRHVDWYRLGETGTSGP